jgi:oxygen-dependent protoporphyrinogen oxidase
VAIVGAGIAGLAAGYELSRRGVRFLILEASPRPGGLLSSDRVGEFTIDAGADAFLIQKPAALELCRQLGIDSRLISVHPPRDAFVLERGRLTPLPRGGVLGIPASLPEILSNPLFSRSGRLRMALDLVLPAGRPAGDDESIAAFVGRRFGREAVRLLGDPLLAGIHGGEAARLSIGALFPRLVAAEQRHGSVVRGLRAMRQPDSNGPFRSLPGGMQELVNAIVAALPDGSMRLGVEVRELRRASRFDLLLSPGGTIAADAVILAAPAHAAARLVEPLDSELARLCGRIPFLSSATVALAYRRDQVAHPLDGSGFVVPRTEPGVTITACTWLSSKWPGRAPGGHVLVRAFLGGARDPGVLGRRDADLTETAHDDLARILSISGPPVLSRVYRWERANPQYEVGHQARVAAIERAAARHRGLHLTGSSFRGVGIPDTIADARRVASAAAVEMLGTKEGGGR